jgi:two-component system, OmpR family, sensor kinase
VSLPIRVRLTAWYAALLALILVALGAYLVVELRADLHGRVDRDVRAVAATIGDVYAAEGPFAVQQVARSALPRPAAGQVLDRGGRVLASFGAADARRPMVPTPTRTAALVGEPVLTTVTVADGRRFRASVSSVRRLGRRHVVVVAASLSQAEAPVRRVLMLLLLAGPMALAATAVVGWWLARKALGPVARMASEADAIEIDRLHERIAVPRAADELGHLAMTLNAMLGRLQRGVAEQRRLVADASHELRTPLAVMRAELDVSLRDDDVAGEARETLESTREEVDRMSRTVDNLLTLARADDGRLELLRTRVELGEAIDAATRPLLPLAEHKDVRVEIGGEPAEAVADPLHVHQALTNLIENAIKFTAPGGTVRISAWRDGREVGVTVADDGPGIPAESLARVFDRFYRVDPARRRDAGGSGLGLAICREVARAHGGRITVDSEEGRGSSFSLVLPGS